MALPRHVIYDFTFEEQARLLEKNTERLDDIIRAAEWRIAAHPETCPVIPGTTLRVVFTDPFPGASAMRIFFSITDAQRCTVHWIERVETGYGEDFDFEDDIPF